MASTRLCESGLPTVPAEMRERIKSLAAEAEALFPSISCLAERTRAMWEEYHATLDDLRLDEFPHLSEHIFWASRDVASERDGLNRLSDAIWNLREVLVLVSDDELRF